LAGQIDYPSTLIPVTGYPTLFIIQHATATLRQQFLHYVRLGTEIGMAVFRWDKRGTGSSGSGGAGTQQQDTLNAYQTAIQLQSVNRQHMVIVAQNEGSLLLHELYEDLVKLQKPLGIILAGNMIDEKQIIRLKTPLLSVVSKNDWNAWQIYAEAAVKAHNKAYHFDSTFYVAPNSNRRLMYEHGETFHRGAAAAMQEWLLKIVPQAIPPTQPPQE
jgi:alpha-beta hydrolase superfamily lysophospholipase